MQSIDIADLYYNKVVIAPSLHCGLAILYGLHSDKHWRHCKYCEQMKAIIPKQQITKKLTINYGVLEYYQQHPSSFKS